MHDDLDGRIGEHVGQRTGIERVIDGAAGDGGDVESPILAARRKQLHRIAGRDPERFGKARTQDDGTWVVSKILKISVDDLAADIGRAEMKRRIDPEEVDRRVLEVGPGREGPAQDGRTGYDIGETPADAHDLGSVRNPLEVAPARGFDFRILGRDEEVVVARTELRLEHDGAVAAEGGIDEAFREPLGLGLGGDENSDSKNDAA